MVEKPAVPKVRYYVREYGGDSDLELRPVRRAFSHGNLTRVGKKVKHVVLEEAVSDTEVSLGVLIILREVNSPYGFKSLHR